MTEAAQPDSGTLDGFLASVERRALRMAELAVGDTDEALDIVQDVMIAFVRRYRRKPADQWPPLFYRSLENRIRDWYRRQSTRNRWLLRLDDRDEPPAAERFADPAAVSPVQRMQHDAFGAALERALQRLPHRQRQAFLYRTWEGLSVADTARAMGCGEGSVKTHLSRAMGALREHLTELGHEP